MMNTKNRLEEIKREGYQLDFSTVFGNAFENYKKIALTAGSLFVLMGMVFGIFIVILLVTVFGLKDSSFFQNFDPESIKPENFSIPFLFAYLVIVVFITALAAPMTAGILKMAHNVTKGHDFSIGTAFDYYCKPFFSEIFVATATLTFFSFSINLMLEFVGITIVGAIISYIISFFTFLTIPFIIFGNLKAVDAIQASFTVVSKQILILFGLLICGFLFAMAGMIGCCIGILFTMPILYSLYYCIYNEVIGVYENEEIEE